MVSSLASELQEELGRLARFGANLADAHSCCIFLPQTLFREGQNLFREGGSDSSKELTLVAAHSLSHDIVEAARVPTQGGLIGWVATHRRPIHVAPFEQDSATLGYYRTPQDLKSLMGVPTIVGTSVASSDSDSLRSGSSRSAGTAPSGVVICDSKKAFAFSKLQGKLLEDLALQVGTTVRLIVRQSLRSNSSRQDEHFRTMSEQFLRELGPAASELVRISVQNLHELESTLGLRESQDALNQLWRLAEQTLPPHFPRTVHCGTEFLVLCDNMLSQLIENKLRSLVDRAFTGTLKPEISIVRTARRSKGAPGVASKIGPVTIDQLVAESARIIRSTSQGGLGRGIRTA